MRIGFIGIKILNHFCPRLGIESCGGGFSLSHAAIPVFGDFGLLFGLGGLGMDPLDANHTIIFLRIGTLQFAQSLIHSESELHDSKWLASYSISITRLAGVFVGPLVDHAAGGGVNCLESF